jgi:hypothetical protein
MATSRETIETKPLVALREFFSTGATRPVQMPEMAEFWKSCNEADKAQFKAELSKWDGQSHFISA